MVAFAPVWGWPAMGLLRALIDEFVMSDPADTRTRFQRDPSAKDVNELHTQLPEVAVKRCGWRYRRQANTEQMTQHGSDWCSSWWRGPPRRHASIGSLDVRPGHRPRGADAALLAGNEHTVRAQGCRQTLLSVTAGNSGTFPFRHRHGFQFLIPAKARRAGRLELVAMHEPLS